MPSTPAPLPVAPASSLYFVISRHAEHSAWGVYRRKRTNRLGLFRLVAVLVDYDQSVSHARRLKDQSPEYDYSVQGARDGSGLPDRYEP